MKLKEEYLKSILQVIAKGIGSAEQIAVSTGLKRSLVNVYMEFLADEKYIEGQTSFPIGDVGDPEYFSSTLLQKGKLAVDDLSSWVFQENAHSTIYDLRGAQFGGGFAAGGGVQVGGILNQNLSEASRSSTEQSVPRTNGTNNQQPLKDLKESFQEKQAPDNQIPQEKIERQRGSFGDGVAINKFKENPFNHPFCTVYLESVPPDRKIFALRVVKGLTKLGLKEAKELIESAPTPVFTGVYSQDTQEAVNSLTEAGARISITQSTCFSSEYFGENYYTKLRDLLAAKAWREANLETMNRMCEVIAQQKRGGHIDMSIILEMSMEEREGKSGLSPKEKSILRSEISKLDNLVGYLQKEDIISFPCRDLCIIDHLWLFYSQGRFGFSVQKKVWEGFKSPTSYNKNWEKFGEIVGWKDRGRWPGWLSWFFDLEKYSFNERAPEGHLPVLMRIGQKRDMDNNVLLIPCPKAELFSSLSLRLEECKI
ncbi:ribosomal protein L7/L12 [Halomicronema sp. CCY15110]|uniref:ribosomal protein L7/L12 n=1 Tax=Halomicronema sp. CCY15110 TaxID=2767773 RepID=UPI001950E959|nr:ribosomal protein L7/L12 [Halomicronema sp. CCY15110]